jgi:group I intron endonuclease
MNTGVYIIRNIINGKIYIGSAVNLERRLKYHRWALNKETHSNIYLQRAWNKDGEEFFVFEEYFYCEVKDLIFHEQLTIDASIVRYGRENIYNISPTAGSTLGRKHSEETKKKIGDAFRGKPGTRLGIKNKKHD